MTEPAKTHERRLTSPLEIRGTPFRETLSEAGKRVAVLDVPHSRADKPLNGVMVSEYACHDRHFGFHTAPPNRTWSATGHRMATSTAKVHIGHPTRSAR